MEENIERLEQAATNLEAAIQERVNAIAAAREAGVTWPLIAKALGVTERAASELLRRHRG